MASGKSIILKGLDNMYAWRRLGEREARERDRSLNGKARIRARKAAQRAARRTG